MTPPLPSSQFRRRDAITAAACLALMLAVVFADILFRDHQFAFQDASHYYYPLLQRVQQEWSAGRIPLWAPEASAGTPLLGNPTAAVLYPGKLIFFAMPFPWAYRLYAIGHVALAALAMGTLLRGWAVSPAGSLLGALAYAFGMPALSQTSNVIFLVGAAWAPLGVLAADRWVRLGRRRALPALAVVLAFQVLGGDPEAAYLTVAFALLYAMGLAVSRAGWSWRKSAAIVGGGLAVVVAVLLVVSIWTSRAMALADTPEGPGWAPPRGVVALFFWVALALAVLRLARTSSASRFLATRGGGVVLAGGLALALAGAQLLPVLEYSRMSFRAAESEGFHDPFAYSANPVQLLDAVWPGLFGRLEGGYRSWLNALPPKPGSRLWMPSLYLGALTLVLALAGIPRGGRERPEWQNGMAGVLGFCVLAALGYFASPVLWARLALGDNGPLGPIEPPFAWQIRHDGHLRDGDVGPYWFLASILPGFRAFRYPPKLFVFAALAAAALAGAGWDRATGGETRRPRRIALVLLSAGLVALAGTFLGESWVLARFDVLADRLRPSDEPLDVACALADLRRALVHGVIASGAVIVLLDLARRRPLRAGGLAVLVLMLDLAAANSGHVVSVPQNAFEGDSRVEALLREAERDNPASEPFRVQRVGRWWPSSWIDEHGVPRSFDTITRWERDTIRPLYNWPLHIDSVFYFDTIEPLDFGLFFLPWTLQPDPAAREKYKIPDGQGVWYHPRRGFDLWAARYFIVPGQLFWDRPERGFASLLPNSTFIYPPPGALSGPGGEARRQRWSQTEDFRILRNEAAFPRAWIVHRARVIPPITGLRVRDRGKVIQDLLYQGDDFWREPGRDVRDLRAMAWVETDRPDALERGLSRAGVDPEETVTFREHSPQRVVLAATLKTPGLVVLADQFYPGWQATVDGQDTEILRTNRAMRGVMVPAGTHQIVFNYNPSSFRLGLGLSAIGLCVLGALVVWSVRGRRAPALTP